MPYLLSLPLEYVTAAYSILVQRRHSALTSSAIFNEIRATQRTPACETKIAAEVAPVFPYMYVTMPRAVNAGYYWEFLNVMPL
jgi:hypothetical protein